MSNGDLKFTEEIKGPNTYHEDNPSIDETKTNLEFDPYQTQKTPINLTLFELCSYIEPIDRRESFSNTEKDLEILQAISRAKKILFEIFIRMARGEKTSDLFGEKQLKYLSDNQFYPDNYSMDCPETSQDILWRTSELFRCWNATNVRSLNLGLSPQIMQDQTLTYFEIFKLIIENSFPIELPTNPFDKYNSYERKKVRPIIFNPQSSLVIPNKNVRFYIDNNCILTPLPTSFFTNKHQILYLNELTQLPSAANNNPKYVIETIIKVIAAGLSLEKGNPKGILISQIPFLWQKYKGAILRRHLIPKHNFDPKKGINFLKHTGLNSEQTDSIDIYKFMGIIQEALKAVKQPKKEIRIRPDGSYKEVKKTKQAKPKKKSAKKHVFALELPGI